MESDPGNDELLEKVAQCFLAHCHLPDWQRRMMARAALAVARPAIKEECAEKVNGQRLIWNKGTSAYTALTDAEAAIRAVE